MRSKFACMSSVEGPTDVVPTTEEFKIDSCLISRKPYWSHPEVVKSPVYPVS